MPPMAGLADLAIAPAREPDAAEVARLMRALCLHEGDPADHATEAAMLRDVCAEGRAVEGLLARMGGAAVGLATWRPCYESAWAARGAFLCDLYVEEGARGRGVGRALVTAVARASAAQGGVFLWLTALRRNERARAFYRRLCDVEGEDVLIYAMTERPFAALVRQGG